ncbi:hypothetical protein ACGFSB_10120 [Streptomyces sp. NPDC048441]|uniref:hypothetical protein n=1 Tax=Streptomyces sp. NPDC048441 TaxID=3365552 RepID=UPI00371C07DA
MTEQPHDPCIHEKQLSDGEEVDLRPVKGERVDASRGAEWGAERRVEAAALARMLLVSAHPAGIHRALWLAGAHIVGTLDLAAAHLTRPLYLEDCYFEAERPVLLNDARAIRVQLPGCHVRGFEGRAMHTQGDLCLSDGFTAEGEVQLQGAHIHGSLDCESGTFTNPGGGALSASRLVVDGSVWFVVARVTGSAQLIGAQIGGQLNCAGSTFDNSDSPQEDAVALEVYGVDVKGSMFLREGFTAVGEIRMSRSRIGGDLDCSQGEFRQVGARSRALNMYGMTVSGTMLCGKGFKATGEVRMCGARIGGELDLSDSRFVHGAAGDSAIRAERLTVESTMKCSEGFTATGGVDITGARIGGDLDCRTGTFTGASQRQKALDAKRITVQGTMKCSDGFTATGEVDLAGGHIGGDLVCGKGTFAAKGDGRKAIDAKRLTVQGTVQCSKGFSATGEIDLTGARIGELEFTDGVFTADRPGGCAITLMTAEVIRGVRFLPKSLSGFVDLRSAKVGRWYDSSQTWSEENKVRLSGFTYTSIDSKEKLEARERLQWIGRDTDGFVPQPYRQLADVYQREGSERDARKIQIAAQWRRRDHPRTKAERALHPLRVSWSALLRIAIGFGYQPWRILAPIGLFYFFGWGWFHRAHQHGDIVPAKALDAEVKFSAARYTADLMIPGANLGERARWLAVDGAAIWAACFTLAGWALAAMLIAGLTGVFKRP